MAKPRISLCLIARNEEALLPACLASARDAVDEMVVVDTGSSDRTIEVARAAGARVLERPWDDDFAAPRNLAAAHATGDFVFQLDADEQLAPGGAAAVRRAVKHAAFDVGLVRCHNAAATDAPAEAVLSGARRVGAPGLLPRLVRRTPDLRWVGCIHESVLEWAAARGNRLAPVAVDLVHYGYTERVFAGKEKRERNLALLRKRVREEPDSAVSLGYLAAELLANGDLAEAEEVAARGWAALERQPRYRSVRRLAVVRAAVAVRRGRPAVALEAAARFEAREGMHPDLAFHRGCALELVAREAAGEERAARLAEAERSFEEALALLARGGFDQVMHATPAQVWARRGVVRTAAGRAAEALECFARSRAAGATDRIALAEAEALLALSRPGDALRALEPVLGAGPEGWLLAARAAQALGAHGDAKVFLAKAQGR
ncbi:MAG TPA: glycosyltransferase family 2 protein [Anaeromyxobacter sp.]|nr:glycosyltransferase family 2 protein [Anaeromyxobacter sp.]